MHPPLSEYKVKVVACYVLMLGQPHGCHDANEILDLAKQSVLHMNVVIFQDHKSGDAQLLRELKLGHCSLVDTPTKSLSFS